MDDFLTLKRRCRTRLFILLALSVMFMVMMHAGIVEAAKPNDKSRPREPAPSIRQTVFRQLESAQRLVEEKNFAQAHKVLSRLHNEKSLSAYESAQAWNLTAYGYYLQGRYRDAIAAYNKVLNEKRIPKALIESTLRTLSQLHFSVEEYRQAIVYAERLMTGAQTPTPDIYLLLGQAYFQLGDYQNAIQPLEHAVLQYREAGKKPKENWLLLLRVIYYELKRYNKMLLVFNELIRLYPKVQHLMTLADVYGELGDKRKQLVLMEALYEKDHLNTTHELVSLANLYILHEIPYKAAMLLEKEMNANRVEGIVRNLRLLSQAWYQAREIERSIPPLQRAAEKSNQGELYLRLAQAYIDLERWREAAAAIEEALVKPGIERPDRAHLMMGTALYHQQKLLLAKAAFEQASKDKRSEQVAKQWLVFLETEIHRWQDEQHARQRSGSAPRGNPSTDS